jgi:hypothetical protein
VQGCQVNESVQTLGVRRTVGGNRLHRILFLTISFNGLAKRSFEEHIDHLRSLEVGSGLN